MPFGSVPLKTYLPDGDIDIALVQRAGPSLAETWAPRLAAALSAPPPRAPRARRLPRPPPVRDVTIVNAEVRLLKCLIGYAYVDVSFGTLGGPRAVAFLEAAAAATGRHALLKRAILLVKAWAFYEARILGAHHGLLSTYGVETMVLAVLAGGGGAGPAATLPLETPLDVLRAFLASYASFDWDGHTLTVLGPVPTRAYAAAPGLPPPARSGGSGRSPPLPPATLAALAAAHVAPSGTPPSFFVPKHINIGDPLLAANNLGRPVGPGAAARARAALALGSSMVEAALAAPPATAGASIDTLFRNAWHARAAHYAARVVPAARAAAAAAPARAPPPPTTTTLANGHAATPPLLLVPTPLPGADVRLVPLLGVIAPASVRGGWERRSRGGQPRTPPAAANGGGARVRAQAAATLPRPASSASWCRPTPSPQQGRGLGGGAASPTGGGTPVTPAADGPPARPRPPSAPTPDGDGGVAAPPVRVEVDAPPPLEAGAEAESGGASAWPSLPSTAAPSPGASPSPPPSVRPTLAQVVAAPRPVASPAVAALPEDEWEPASPPAPRPRVSGSASAPPSVMVTPTGSPVKAQGGGDGMVVEAASPTAVSPAPPPPPPPQPVVPPSPALFSLEADFPPLGAAAAGGRRTQ